MRQMRYNYNVALGTLHFMNDKRFRSKILGKSCQRYRNYVVRPLPLTDVSKCGFFHKPNELLLNMNQNLGISGSLKIS